jgi:hypothetical protein
MLDTGCWILDAGYWMLDTGYWLLGANNNPTPNAHCPMPIFTIFKK